MNLLILHRAVGNLSVVVNARDGRFVVDLLAIRTGPAGGTGTGEHSETVARWRREVFGKSRLYAR